MVRLNGDVDRVQRRNHLLKVLLLTGLYVICAWTMALERHWWWASAMALGALFYFVRGLFGSVNSGQ